MRINRNILIAATFMAAAISITSCSQDETIGERHSDGAIGFSPLLKGATATGTRMVNAAHSYGTVGGVNLPDNFDVWAFTSTAATNTTNKVLYMGAQNDGIKIKKASTISNANELGWSATNPNGFYWGYDQQGEVTYWPADELRFYAISPAFDSVNGIATPGTPVSTDDPIIKDPVFLNTKGEAYFSAKVTDDNMDDILIGVKNQSANISGNAEDYQVNLDFHHALAKVTFLGKMNSAINHNIRVEINSIKIVNILSEGACSIGFDNTVTDFHGPTGVIQWGKLTEASGVYTFTPNTYDSSVPSGTNYLSTYATYNLEGNKKIAHTAIPASSTDLLYPDKAFEVEANFGSILVLPQYITKWASTANEAEPNDNTASTVVNKGTYIEIKYDWVSQNGVTILPANTVAYVPVTSTLWEAGKHYTYTLYFGLGVKKNGDPMGAPITFTVDSVTDWNTTGTATDINLQN